MVFQASVSNGHWSSRGAYYNRIFPERKPTVRRQWRRRPRIERIISYDNNETGNTEYAERMTTECAATVATERAVSSARKNARRRWEMTAGHRARITRWSVVTVTYLMYTGSLRRNNGATNRVRFIAKCMLVTYYIIIMIIIIIMNNNEKKKYRDHKRLSLLPRHATTTDNITLSQPLLNRNKSLFNATLKTMILP